MINKVILVGNLGKDPDIKTTATGVSVALFTMATTEWYRDKENQLQSKTEWHNIVAWQHLAEKAQKNLKKGSKVYVEGKITSRNYETSDGTKRYITEIVARELMPLDKKEGSSGAPLPPEPENNNFSRPNDNSQNHTLPNSNISSTSDIEDDLPF